MQRAKDGHYTFHQPPERVTTERLNRRAESERGTQIPSPASAMQTAANLNSRAEGNRGTRILSPASVMPTAAKGNRAPGATLRQTKGDDLFTSFSNANGSKDEHSQRQQRRHTQEH